MHRLVVGFGALVLMLTAGTPQAEAASRPLRPYCLDAERTHMKDCSYHSFQQCLDTARGLGGICYANPAILWQQRGAGDSQRSSRGRRE
jgi:hypothetical protein